MSLRSFKAPAHRSHNKKRMPAMSSGERRKLKRLIGKEPPSAEERKQ